MLGGLFGDGRETVALTEGPQVAMPLGAVLVLFDLIS